MQGADVQLEKYLLESGIIPRAVLMRAKEKALASGDSLSDALVDQGLMTPDELRRALAHMHGMPFVRLSREMIDMDAMSFIPEPFARAHSTVAFRDTDQGLEVAFLDLDDLHTLDTLSLPRRILPRLTDAGSIKTALLMYQKKLRQEYGDAISREAQAVEPPSSGEERDIQRAADAFPVTNLVDLLLDHAFMHRASDVHLDKTAAGYLVRYRIGGALCDAMLLPSRTAPAIAARLKLLARLPLKSDVSADGKFKIGAEGERAFLRKEPAQKATVTVSVTPTWAGERIVLHLIPEHTGRDGFTLEALGMGGSQLERVHDALSKKSGLVIVSGAASSGKTTTLYTLLDLLVRADKNIISVEQDVECPLRGVVQTRPHEALGISYAGAVRAALKQDPDVLMVGSIDDEEIAQLAVAAANRGILVLAGLTAQGAAEGTAELSRRVNLNMAASVLRAVIGVGRVKKLCDKHGSQTLTRADMNAIEAVADPARVLISLKDSGKVDQHATWKSLQFGTAQSCPMCDLGYAGYLGLQEVLPITATIQSALKEGVDAEEIQRIAREEGMLTLAEDGVAKAIQGRTSLEEVLK